MQDQQLREQRQLEEDLFGLSSAFNNQNQYGYNQTPPQQQYDPFGSIQQDGFGDNFNGQWANPFGNAFDGGSSARPLPHQLAGDNANTQIAHIARNAQQIDPFASLAASRSSAPVNSAPAPVSNPDPVIRPTVSGANSMAYKPASRFTPTVNISSNPMSGNRELVNLSAQALTPSNAPSNKNPFGQPATPATRPTQSAFDDAWDQPPPQTAQASQSQPQQWGSSSKNPFASDSFF